MSSDRFDAAILIVDDQPVNIHLMTLILSRTGYSAVTSTADPSQVCALQRVNGYDLIILDLQMPRMNGFEVLQALKACEAHTPPAILVMSADPAQRVPALTAGATSFLGKPFELKGVVQAVHDLLVEAPPRNEVPAAA
jgi:adenylate cyclase